MSQTGANISTRMGEGEAGVFNWEPLHRQVNMLIQRDLHHQRAMQDAANKSALELQKAGAAARPEDIPELTNLFNTFRTTGVALLNPKLKPEERAAIQRAHDESELGYHSLANDSKNTGKTLAALPLEYAKAGGNGFKPIDEFGKQLQQAKGLTTRQIKEQSLDNPISYMGARELYPAKDYQQHVYGGFESTQGSDPVKNAKGETIAWQDKRIKQPKNPIPVVVHNTVEAMNGIPTIHKRANDEFMNDVQGNEPMVDQTIKTAQDYVTTLSKDQQEHILPYLRKDPLGYEMAKNILGARPETVLGKQTEDPLYKQKQTQADAWARLKYSKGIAEQMQARGFRHSEKMKAITVKNASGGSEDFDTRPMYEAAKNPDKVYIGPDGKKLTGRDIVDNYSQAVAANNSKNITAVTISKGDLFDDNKRRALYDKLGLEPLPPRIPGRHSLEEIKKYDMKDFLTKLNKKYEGQIKIEPEDLDKYAIPAYIRRSYTKDEKGDLVPQVTLSSANPATNDYGAFHSVVSQQTASKKKSNEAKQPEDVQTNIEMDEDGNLNVSTPPKSKGLKRIVEKVKKKAKEYGL